MRPKGSASVDGNPASIAPPRRLDLNLLTVFAAIWQHRHVGRAAEALALSQPATSHALARLRDVVGDPLFVRVAGGMQPTPRAAAMWPRVETVLREAGTALGSTLDPFSLGRRLVIGISTNVAIGLLEPLARALARERPELDVALRTADGRTAGPMLLRGEIDLFAGVWRGDLAGHLVRRPLVREPMVLVARAGHALEGSDVPLDIFAATPQLLVAPSGEPHGPIDRMLRAHNLTRRIALVVPDYHLAARAIGVSDLIGMIARSAFDQLAAEHGLIALAGPIEPEPIVIDLVAPAGLTHVLNWVAGLAKGSITQG